VSGNYAFFPSLEAEAEFSEERVGSRTLHNDDHAKLILFASAPGQELPAHAAPMAASLYFVSGEATLTLGDESREVRAGAYVHMAPQLRHGILARTPVTMLLTMHKQARG
jgi:quercetin dioxygenase-like cupin family protein